MSIYLALHTSVAPSIGDIAKFGAEAIRLGAKPDQPLAIGRDQDGAMTVVLPIPTALSHCPYHPDGGNHPEVGDGNRRLDPTPPTKGDTA